MTQPEDDPFHRALYALDIHRLRESAAILAEQVHAARSVGEALRVAHWTLALTQMLRACVGPYDAEAHEDRTVLRVIDFLNLTQNETLPIAALQSELAAPIGGRCVEERDVAAALRRMAKAAAMETALRELRVQAIHWLDGPADTNGDALLWTAIAAAEAALEMVP